MSSIEIATLKARVEFLEKQNQKIYESFKNKVSQHIYKEIIEKLELPNEIAFVSRDEISNILNNVTDNWEDNYDNFIEEFEEVNMD